MNVRGRPAAEAVTWGMGTVIAHKVYGGWTAAALRAAEAEILRLERLLSRYRADSDISRMRIMAGNGTVKVSGEAFEVLTRAYEFSEDAQGAFDVTVGPLASLWNATNRPPAPPSECEIKNALPLVDYTGLILNNGRKTAGLKKAGQSIDLGGIAKGYAADRMIGIFKRYGAASAYTNFGGNVAVMGAKPDGAPWRVGIRHPRREGDIIGVVSVADASVVTSGDYQRCFITEDGKRYHHILDPRSGYPADSGLVSVTVVAGSSMDADALSTAVFVLGKEKGVELLSAFKGVEAVLVGADMRVYVTGGLAGAFQPAKETEAVIID